VAALTAQGLGSGLQIGDIIEQLMTIERRPLVKLQTQVVELKAQLSAQGKLRSAFEGFESVVNGFDDPDEFLQFKASSSDQEVLTVSASETASRGSYRIEVNRLAENHRVAASSVYTNPDIASIGSAGETVAISVGSESFTIEFGGKTLNAIRDAINSATDNPGVTASIIQDDTGYRLTLGADEVGSENLLATSYSGADPFSFQTLNADRDGQNGFEAIDLDAQITLEDSFVLTRPTNTISDAVAGLSLELKDAGDSIVSVSRDDANTLSLAQQFVKAYNDVIKAIDSVGEDILRQDRASLRNMQGQLRSILNQSTGDSAYFKYLIEIGVTTQLNGTLTIDTAAFNAAVAKDPEGIASMFTDSTNGIGARYSELTDNLVGAGGVLDGRANSVNARIRQLELQRSSLEARLARKNESLVRQFTALDAYVGTMTNAGNFLQQQLEQISAVSKSILNK
jgi:flagellar hook-associated protein 2